MISGLENQDLNNEILRPQGVQNDSVFVGVATPTYFAPQGACRAQNNEILRHCEEQGDEAIQLINKQESGSKSKALLNDNSHTSIHPDLQTSKLAPIPTFPHRGRRCAFTLAEVLITLGIIGIVAALTLPTLIQQHRKSVVETRLAKFYSTMNQAIQRAEVDYGDKKYWDKLESGFETDEEGNPDYSKSKVLPWFNKYLRPYLNVAKIDESSKMEGRITVYFTDGSAVLIAGTWLFFPDAKKLAYGIYGDQALVNVNRANGGSDLFTFGFYPERGKGLEPYMYWKDDVFLRTNYTQGCKNNAIGGERALCAALIKKNGWKIPSDYPLKF